MKLLAYFTVFLLTGLVSTAPVSNSEDDDKIKVTPQLFPEEFAVYKAEHEIVNIMLPLNNLNFEEDVEDDDNNDAIDSVIFFTLADTVDGKQEPKGLYIRKKGKVTKLLDNGVDFASGNEDTKVVYLAATDGIYYYDDDKNTAEKYGTVDESIINITKVNDSDILYVLTEDHVLYKVTEQGTKKEKIDSVVNAQQIVLDYENNLYYYTADKNVYVLNPEGAVKKIDGLPEVKNYIRILRPPFVIENGVPVVLDDKSYVVTSDGKSELSDFEFEVHPTAYAAEGTLIQYYAYNKTIYEYNILLLIMGELLTELKNFLQDKTDSISEIATRSRSDLRA